MNNEITRIYQAINAVSQRINDLAKSVELSLTPYKNTKTAYYGESEKNFYDVPEGILTVHFDNYTGSYSVERIDDRLTVSFDTLENDTNITIIVQ